MELNEIQLKIIEKIKNNIKNILFSLFLKRS